MKEDTNIHELVNNNEHKTVDSSVSSIVSITLPILLTALSMSTMFAIDRFMLGKYSLNSMNAAVMSGNFVVIFSYMLVGIAASAEVYVGQYNGDKQYDRLGGPVWQMIRLSVFCILIFAPIAYFSEYFNTLPEYFLEEGLAFQRPLMYFAFLPGAIVAFSAFFIGQGKAKIVTNVVVSGTVLNAVLAYIFVLVLRKGCFGAACATIIAESAQVTTLGCIFFSKNNRRIYKTWSNRKFDKELFLGCIKIGGPLSLSNFMALAAWYVVQTAVSHVSKEEATIYNVCINLYVLSIFFGDGLNKAIATISANMVARRDLPSIQKTYRIFIAMGVIFFLLISIPMVLFPDVILSALDMINGDIAKMHDKIKTLMIIVSINNLLETAMMVTCGVLISGGDSKYPTVVNQTLIWTVVILPVMIMYRLNLLTAMTSFTFSILWLSISFSLMYRRYKSLKWYNKLV